ncbi:MAG: hypothetical protein Q9218_007677 [Villophora microphyllina]
MSPNQSTSDHFGDRRILWTDLLTARLVTVIVGEKRKSYHVHSDLLCDRSAHFRAALSGNFHEAQISVIEFPEEEEATFEAFLGWLYASDLDIPENLEELTSLVQLLCFARSILLEELSNLCIDNIRLSYMYRAEEHPSEPLINVDDLLLMYVYPVGSKLRFCLCWQAAIKAYVGNSLEAVDKDLPRLMRGFGDFSVDFARLSLHCTPVFAGGPDTLSLRRSGALFESDRDCVFHDHRTTKPCSVRMPSEENETIRHAISLLD